MKKIICCLLFSMIFLTACTTTNSQSENKLVDNNISSKNATQNSEETSEVQGSSNISYDKDEDENLSDTSEQEIPSLNESETEKNISEEVKDYIINGQENKPDVQKIKWSKTFLNQVDIESLYNNYRINGGDSNDLEEFANYITSNSPILSNWESLFEEDLYDIYGEKVVRLEYLEGDLYQAYIEKDGAEVPYVVVSARTGYFHG